MSDPTLNVILGTAGHIDHGKTSLVKALTGIDTDWLPEEKARGMTIDIGIAYLRLAGRTVGLVDVPGHERFVRTMVAGASGVDVGMLVVAADDGVMPQTVEHFEILCLLGIDHGVVALNKVDLVGAARLEEVRAEIRHLVDGTAFEKAAVVEVSAVTGQGVEALRAALEAAVAAATHRRRSFFFREPIDRVFSIPGRGTVVTGSMLGGEIHVGDRVELLPEGRELRVRGLQTHQRSVEDLTAGQRTAVNLAGIKKEEIHRGMELAAPGYLTPTTYLDVEARCLPMTPKGLPSFVRVRLAIGTREVIGRLVDLEGHHLAPGRTALCQLRLHEPVVAEYGQRFILRDETAVRTVGGGRVLRALARRISPMRAAMEREALRRLAAGDGLSRVGQVLADAGIRRVAETAVAARAGVPPAEVREHLQTLEARGDLLRVPGLDHPVHTSAIRALGERICRHLERFHAQNPQVVGLDRHALGRTFQRSTSEAVLQAAMDRLREARRIVEKLNKVALATFKTEMTGTRRKLWERLREELLKGECKPPSEANLVEIIGGKPTAIKEVLQQAEAQGEVVQVHKGLYFPAETLEAVKEKMRELYAASGPFSVSVFREHVGTTRKYAVPLCEYLDRTGFTRREGDLRVVADR